MLFCTFLCCHCMTTTWKCLIASFMEDVNKRWWIFLSLSKLEWGLQEFNSMEICLHLTFSANYKSLKKREFILKVTFLVPSASSMLKLPRLSVKWWWMKLKLSIVAETVYCIVLFQFLWCQRKFDGGGLKKNEGTCTYGVVSGRSGSGLIWYLMVKWLSDKERSR